MLSPLYHQVIKPSNSLMINITLIKHCGFATYIYKVQQIVHLLRSGLHYLSIRILFES